MIIHSGWKQEAECNPSYLLYLIMEVRYKRGQAVNKLVDEVISPICYSKRGQTGVEVHYSHLLLILLFLIPWKCLCKAREAAWLRQLTSNPSHLLLSSFIPRLGKKPFRELQEDVAAGV